jgi:signal transduction histidine kinase
LLRPERRFVLDSAVTELSATADATHVRRILQNLLDNAVAYSPHGTSICVRLAPAEERDTGAIFEVEDEGPGIPEPVRQEIFNPFVRMSASPGNGNGLGLYIVRCLAAAIGGHAWVENGAVGALFKVYLPRQTASPSIDSEAT